MERSDAELLEGIKKGEKAPLDEVFTAFERGDRGAYNLLVGLLKRSEPHAEQTLRGYFAGGDGLVAELICQAYYPFVEALCKYKFKEKSPQEITEITSRVLGDFVKGAPQLQTGATMKNQLYQRVCSVYKERLEKESSSEKISSSASNNGDSAPQEPVASDSPPQTQAADASENHHFAGHLPLPRRHHQDADNAKVASAAAAALEETAAKAVAAAAAAASKTAANVESVLPPLESEKKNQPPKLKGFPSESHEAKTTSPHSVQLIKSLSQMSERDFTTYQIIAEHYFGRKGYQQLCQEMGNRSLVDIGNTLCKGLLELGREVFGQSQ
ncbi:MAG: hypothetical protein Q4F00_03055 [bacterium]|nr:hypothetical protein [bacterium]